MPGPPTLPSPGQSLTAKTQSWRPPCRKVSSRKGGAEHGPGRRVRPWPRFCRCPGLTGNREALLAELKAGAESGWDFSSRWLVGGRNPSSLSSIRTSKLVPVDLNAFLCQVEGLMSNFYSRLGTHAHGEGKKGASPARVPASALAVELQGGP